MKIIKNNLKKELRDFFEYRIFERGKEYYKDDCVEKIRASCGKENKIIIEGDVLGTYDYVASFIFDLKDNSFSELECDCPYDDYCKHLAALGLEFIDLYEEFVSAAGNDFFDNQKLKNDFVGYINTGKLKKYDDTDERKVIDAEFEEAGSENLIKETLQKIGVDVNSIPENLLTLLVDQIEKASPQEPKLPCKKLVIKKDDNKKVPKKFYPEEYNIILDCCYFLNVHIYKKSNKYNKISPGKFLNGDFELTAPQKELFELLKRYNLENWNSRDKIDYGKLFLLLKESNIPIFKENGYSYSAKRMKFLDNPEKIKAELILEKRDNFYNNHTEHNFIFKLDNEYKIKNYRSNKSFFIRYNHLVYINDTQISIYELSSHLIQIISRIKMEEDYGYREKLMTTELKEEDLINLNQIIEDGKKYLDLKTDILPNYNIKNFGQPDSCVEVDFDASNALLNIKPVLDYGFVKNDVSETVFYSRHKKHFKRRDYKNQENYVMHIDADNIFYAPLEKEKEISLYKSFYNKQKTGFTKTLKCKRKGERDILSFFENNWDSVKKIADKKKCKIIFTRDEFNFSVSEFRADFDVDLNADNDWLWFDAKCYCGDDKISLEDLKKYAEDKEGFFKMADGRFLKIANFEDLERFIMMLESFYAREQGGFEGKLYHATELDYVFTSSEYYNAKMKKSFKEFIKEAQRGRPVEKVKINSKMAKILRKYQKEGIDWLYFLRKYRFAGILADDMGLGKTLQALSILDKEKVEGKPSVVICPKTLLYNWQIEAEKFVPNLKTVVIDGFPEARKKQIKKAKKYDLIVTGYATMKKDYEIYKDEKIKFNYCILDEAQFIKNHTTKNAQIIKKIDADYRVALTGTPLENSVSEIWSIFDFLMPGFLGSNRAFVKKFQNPIMKKNNISSLENLRKKIECFMLRRTKQEVLKELPPKIEQISHCALEPAQNILYQEILKNVKKDILDTVKEKGFNKSRIHILAGLTKLRQVCNHPALLLKDKKYSKYESAKLNNFLELIEEIVENKRKVLVFSQFTKMLDILEEELKKNKISYNYLSGKTKKRQELVDDFNQNDAKKVFLISLKAGGTGLNLTSADNVIIFDPWWNPSVENQAIDRTHRIGQKKSVNVYRLITQGTIEERIMALKEKKKNLFDNLVGETKDLFQKLTWDDVRELFR